MANVQVVSSEGYYRPAAAANLLDVGTVGLFEVSGRARKQQDGPEQLLTEPNGATLTANQVAGCWLDRKIFGSGKVDFGVPDLGGRVGERHQSNRS